MAEAEPDWYPDPRKVPGVFRWWNGREWTDLLSSDPGAPPPAAEEVARSVAPSRADEPGESRRSNSARRRLSLRLATVGAVLLAVLVAMTLYGFRTGSAQHYPSAPPTSFGPPRTPPPPVPDLVVDEQENTVAVAGRLTATMPAPPWDPAIEYTFEFGHSGATRVGVHPEYSGEESWYGIVTFGVLERQYSQPSDPEERARAVLDSLLDDPTFFHSPPFRPSSVDLREVPVPREPELHRFDIRVPVDEPGLATTANDIVIIMADLGEEKVGAWVEMLPNDTDPELRAAVEESRATLALE